MGFDVNDMGLLKQLHDKYVKEIDTNNTNNKEENGMENFKEGLSNIEKAVKDLKAKELTKAQKQMENFLNDGIDPVVKASKEKFLTMTANQQAEIRKNNPEMFEKMFPSEKVEMPMPQGYKEFKKLITDRPEDSHKLPYAHRLYASIMDAEFTAFLHVAETSIKAEQNSKMYNQKLKELEAAEKAADQK